MRIGSLFSGAAGLDRAVEAVFGGEVVWFSEIDKAASKVLAYRWPDVPNLGSITEIDWATVEPVDVLCGGFPCTDVSAAGKRAGMHGTRSGLWSHMAEAIDVLRPQYVVIENVRGLLNAPANRPLESAEDVVGDGSDGSVLRAIGAVLGDLADIGSYEARWVTLAAASVGAPHRRERVFIVATDATVGGRDSRITESEGQRRQPVVGPGGDCTDSVDLLPTPTAQAAKHGAESRFGGGNGDVSNLWQIAHLLPKPESQEGNMLPTPRATDGTDGPVTNCPSVQAICDGSAGRSPRLSEMAAGGLFGDEPGVALLPTPIAADCGGSALHPDRRKELNPKHRFGGGNGDVSNLWQIHHLLLPTPTSRDHKGRNQRDDETCLPGALLPIAASDNGWCEQCWMDYESPTCLCDEFGYVQADSPPMLLPTPAAKDGSGGCIEGTMGGKRPSGAHRTIPLATAIHHHLLSTPTAQPGSSRSGDRIGEPLLRQQAREMESSWGKYAPAIARWEQIVGPAPAPTEPNKNGNPRLSAAFSEWLMGWPAGWVTDPAIGISRNDQLRIVGNGVCTQQAIAALRYLLAVTA